MMKRVNHIRFGLGSWALCWALCLLMVSCAEKESNPLPAEGTSLCLSVKGIQNLSDNTRSMFVGTNRLADLEQSCTGQFFNGTDEPSTAHQCIRINASYQEHGKTNLTPLFQQNELIFNKVDNTFFTQWNYAGPQKEWVKGAIYQFRAFYPGKSEKIGSLPGVQQIQGVDATQIELQYFTQNVQEDLLVASASGGSPVQLDFRHALAAVRFKFRFDNDVVDDDRLMSCQLRNMANADELFSRVGCFGNIGSMTYGNGDINASEKDREYMEWKVNWCEESSYIWNHKSGIEFSRDEKGNVKEATAYTGEIVDLYSGAEFVDNEGWIYVIPQTITKGLQLCFRTRDNTVREFNVPLMGHMGAGKNDPIVFEAGNRYTYTLVFTKTSLEVLLDIAPWEEVDLPVDIEM